MKASACECRSPASPRSRLRSTVATTSLGIDDVVTRSPDGSADGNDGIGDAGADAGPIDSGPPMPGCAALDGSVYLCADFDVNLVSAYIYGEPQGIFQTIADSTDASVTSVIDAGTNGYSPPSTLYVSTPEVDSALHFAELYVPAPQLTKSGSKFRFIYHVRFGNAVNPTASGVLVLAYLTLLPLDGGAGFAAGYQISAYDGELWETAYAFSPSSSVRAFGVGYKPPVGSWAKMELDIDLVPDGTATGAAKVTLLENNKTLYSGTFPAVSPTAIPYPTIGISANGVFTPAVQVEYDDVIVDITE